MSVKTSQGDAELLAATRNGDAAAYRVLHRRHAPAAYVLARLLLPGGSGAEAEDVVEETFARIHRVIDRGGGPEQAFRPYLLTALRRVADDRSGTAGDPPPDPCDPADAPEGGPPALPADPPAGPGHSPVARAFLSLPERWQLVLWHTEAERGRPEDTALLLGLTVNGTAALAYRAREGMRQACLRIHLAETTAPECRPVLARLGPYIRDGLTREQHRLVNEHVDGCSGCRAVLAELTGVGRSIRSVVGPLIVGPEFPGYLAALAKMGAIENGGLPGRWRRVPPAVRRAVVAGAVIIAIAGMAALVVGTAGEIGPPRTSASEPIVVLPPPGSPVPARSPSGTPDTGGDMGGDGRPRSPSPLPQLVARIDAIGALIRSEAGIVAVRLRNEGQGQSEEVVAHVGLPRGVTLLAGARAGQAVGGVTPVGTVDGWSCRAWNRGARCVRGPLPAGRATAVFLRVLVSDDAAYGAQPSVTVSSSGTRVVARSVGGVRASGAPARFATDGRVAVSAIGNTLLSCAPSESGCEGARSRQGGRRDNNSWEMRLLDRDGDPSTSSSSAARLLLPAESKVVWAGLYWSASAPSSGRIKLKVPGQTEYRRVRATEVVERELPAGRGYQAFADVTRLLGGVRGTYWVADASVRPGVSRHAGWSLVVIVADPRRPYSQAAVVDTARVLAPGHRVTRIPLGGLTPAGAPARVTLVTWEGDAGVGGERVRLGGRTLRPSGGDRDPRNPFDGSAAGALGAGMTFGTDVDRFRAPLGRDPVLELSTRQDVLLFGVAAVSARIVP